MYQIEVKKLKKYFNKKIVLKDIDFKVKKGELMCLLGPSGCGKSTTLKIISGLTLEDSGEIYLKGKLSNKIPAEKRGAIIVFQDYALFPHMSVYDNIAFGLKIKKVNKDILDKKVKDMIEILKLKGFENKFPKELSGGQKQRVSIGRALAVDPEVLLLDEPFANLDINIKSSIREMILDIQKKLKVTTILVTHDKEDALTMADKIALMIDGSIMQYGTPKELYEKPITKEVADFFGERNYIKCISKNSEVITEIGNLNVELKRKGEFNIVVNPEDISIGLKEKENSINGQILKRTYAGEKIYYIIKCKDKILKVTDYSKNLYKVSEMVKINIDFNRISFLN
ncbi:ABC transporter ATP-binding protein [Clostridium oceanicum]|uniref:ABC transporter ATP-binding protein n=1 Tax=Clostridium oceanicum TaxID=1543 RepID=A0ABN1JF79_9CLOT